MPLDSYRIAERKIFSKPPEAYDELFDKKMARVKELGDKRPRINIPELTFVEHLAANWKNSDEYLHGVS